MGTINIKALFDGKAVQTGLERVAGQAKRVGADLDKSFSLTSMAKSAVGAFAGLKLVEIFVTPLKEGLSYLEKMTAASRTLLDVQQRGYMSRNSTEQNIPVLNRVVKRKTADLGRVNGQLGELPDFANSGYAQTMAKVSETMGLSGVPGSMAFQKSQYDKLTEEKNQLTTELTELGNEIANTTRELATANRHLADETESIFDQRDVRHGKMSGVQAAQAAADRAAREYEAVVKTRGEGTESLAALNAGMKAQDAAEIAANAFEKDRVQGVLPQISASSLAQLGGGGNVNVFGGREGEGVSQLREQTRLLREMNGKMGKGMRLELELLDVR